VAFILRFVIKALFEVIKGLVKLGGQLAQGVGNLAGGAGKLVGGSRGGGVQIKFVITKNRFSEMRRKGTEAMLAALDATADTVVKTAKQRAPVETGRLRDSIQREGSGDSIVIFTNVPYAAFVEFGSPHRPAQAFLRPAMRVGSNTIASEVKKRFPKH
jgi:HK97 gp10 family phage protein